MQTWYKVVYRSRNGPIWSTKSVTHKRDSIEVEGWGIAAAMKGAKFIFRYW
jgi:hypothetical protein